jgi:hypothetical protein
MCTWYSSNRCTRQRGSRAGSVDRSSLRGVCGNTCAIASIQARGKRSSMMFCVHPGSWLCSIAAVACRMLRGTRAIPTLIRSCMTNTPCALQPPSSESPSSIFEYLESSSDAEKSSSSMLKSIRAAIAQKRVELCSTGLFYRVNKARSTNEHPRLLVRGDVLRPRWYAWPRSSPDFLGLADTRYARADLTHILRHRPKRVVSLNPY